MKIAVASMGTDVSPHFGHCENFWVFETDGEKIISSTSIVSPGHDSGVVLPHLMADQGVTLMISGGMGQGAKDRCDERNMEVITGASGTAQSAVEQYLAGKLVSTGQMCEGHHHD